jgi:hypothetical protein
MFLLHPACKACTLDEALAYMETGNKNELGHPTNVRVYFPMDIDIDLNLLNLLPLMAGPRAASIIREVAAMHNLNAAAANPTAAPHEPGITNATLDLARKDYIKRHTVPITEQITKLQTKLTLAGDPYTAMKISDQVEDLRKEIADLPKKCVSILKSACSRKEKLQRLNR